MCVMSQVMCLVNTEACKPVQVDTQTKSMNLKMSRICLMLQLLKLYLLNLLSGL